MKKNSPHHLKHQRSKAVRLAKRTPTEEVTTPEPSVQRLKKGLLRADEDSPKKKKRARLRQSELKSFESDMKQKKARNLHKESKRTTPGEVDYETTRASAHPQKGHRFPDVNTKHSKDQAKRMQNKLNKQR